MELQERILRYIAACPPAISGAGGHNTTFTVACALVNGFGLERDDALFCLQQWNVRCQPPWDEKDLIHKVESAMAAAHSKPRGHLIAGNGSFKTEDFKSTSFPAKAAPKPPVQVLDPSTVIEIFLKGFKCTEGDLWDASPIKPSEDFTQDGALLVAHLFRPGELVNFVTDFKLSEKKCNPIGYGSTTERNALLDEWSLGMPQSDCGGWMRMNPIDGRGVADKNITSFRHILLEFDSIPLDLQINLLARVPLPISCILTSGGRSIHAWVRSDSQDATGYKDDAGMLLKMLTRFGLDAKNKNPSRLSRLPGVVRKIGGRDGGTQRLLYLNPNPTQKPIL